MFFFNAFSAHAQTNSPTPPADITSGVFKVDPTISGGAQQIWDATTKSTNFAVVFGGGRSIKGNHNLAFANYSYALNESGSIAALLGYDAIGEGSHFSSQGISFVKGGVNFKTAWKPLNNFGLTNFVLYPFGSLLIDSGNGEVGEILVGGVDWQLALGHGWALNLGAMYENRTGGNTATDGVYLGGFLAASRNWWFGGK